MTGRVRAKPRGPILYAALLLALAVICLLGIWVVTRARSPEAVSFHRAWLQTLDDNVDSSPIEVKLAQIDKKREPVLLVVAGNNAHDCEWGARVEIETTYAFVATTGRLLWKDSLHGPARCTTAAPAESDGWVYTPGFDGKVHRYSLATGREYHGHGWPETYTTAPHVEKASAALEIWKQYLYVTTSGYTGAGPGHYVGHLVTIDLRTGIKSVWNSLCSNIHTLLSSTPADGRYCPVRQAGMFGRDQAEHDPATGDVVVVTGDGPWNGRNEWGDSVLELTPNGKRLVDSFTPKSQDYLYHNDLDLGSTTPALLPPVGVEGRRMYLAVQGGKGPDESHGGPAVLWLLNRRRLDGGDRPGLLGGQLGTITAPGDCEVLTAPAVWRHAGHTYIYYANACAVQAYELLTTGPRSPRLVRAWGFAGDGFTTPVVAGDLLIIAHSGALVVYDPRTGRRLWTSSSKSSGGSIAAVHWEYPLVRGKWIFMTDESRHLIAYERR